MEYTYFAFISYQRSDEDWAAWLQEQIEHYSLPSTLQTQYPELPESLSPIFRDQTDLNGGNLTRELKNALNSSRFLIVICSPSAAQSQWVNKEVEAFIAAGKIDFIIPFIVAGTPYSTDNECFPAALAALRGSDDELLGISVAESGREPASVKVIAQMLGLHFDNLWQRYERDKELERQRLLELNNKITRNLSRYVSEKAEDLLQKGDSLAATALALEVVPTAKHPDFPLTSEAETILRRAMRSTDITLSAPSGYITCAAFSDDNEFFAYGTSEGLLRVYRLESFKLVLDKQIDSKEIVVIAFNPQRLHIAVASDDKFKVYEIKEDGDPTSSVELFTDDFGCKQLLYSPDGRFLIDRSYTLVTINKVCDNEYEYYDHFDVDEYDVACSPDSEFLIHSVDNQFYKYIFAAEEQKKYGRNLRGKYKSIETSPDGKILRIEREKRTSYYYTATGKPCRETFDWMEYYEDDNHIKFRDIYSGKYIGCIIEPMNILGDVYFSKDKKKWAALKMYDTMVVVRDSHVWPYETESGLFFVQYLWPMYMYYCLSAKNNQFISLSEEVDCPQSDGVFRLGSGEKLFSFPEDVTDAYYTPDESAIVTKGKDELKFFDSKSFAELGAKPNEIQENSRKKELEAAIFTKLPELKPGEEMVFDFNEDYSLFVRQVETEGDAFLDVWQLDISDFENIKARVIDRINGDSKRIISMIVAVKFLDKRRIVVFAGPRTVDGTPHEIFEIKDLHELIEDAERRLEWYSLSDDMRKKYYLE